MTGTGAARIDREKKLTRVERIRVERMVRVGPEGGEEVRELPAAKLSCAGGLARLRGGWGSTYDEREGTDQQSNSQSVGGNQESKEECELLRRRGVPKAAFGCRQGEQTHQFQREVNITGKQKQV